MDDFDVNGRGTAQARDRDAGADRGLLILASSLVNLIQNNPKRFGSRPNETATNSERIRAGSRAADQDARRQDERPA